MGKDGLSSRAQRREGSPGHYVSFQLSPRAHGCRRTGNDAAPSARARLSIGRSFGSLRHPVGSSLANDGRRAPETPTPIVRKRTSYIQLSMPTGQTRSAARVSDPQDDCGAPVCSACAAERDVSRSELAEFTCITSINIIYSIIISILQLSGALAPPDAINANCS